MLVELKRVLDKYTEEELKDMDLWIDAKDQVRMIVLEECAVTLLTEDGKDHLQINGKDW